MKEKKSMKRIIFAVLVAIMMLVLVACGSSETAEQATGNQDATTSSDSEMTGDEVTGDTDNNDASVDAEGTKKAEYLNSAQFGSKKDETLTILMVPKLIGIPFYDRGEEGALEAAEDFNCKIIFDGPTDADATEQATIIENYIAGGGIDVICVAPNDADTLTPVLQSAREQGIMVMYFDSMANDDDVDMGVTACTVETIGQAYWDTLVKYAGEDCNYVIMTGGYNAENLNNWMEAGLSYAEEQYPNMNLLTDKIANEENTQVAYEQCLEVLKTYDELDGIICMATSTAPGVAQALRESDMVGEIAVIGMSTPAAMADYLSDGSVTENIIWDCGRMCYANVFLARCFYDGTEVVDGTDPTANLEDSEIGPVAEIIGGIEVNYDNMQVTLGQPLYITADNVADYNW